MKSVNTKKIVGRVCYLAVMVIIALIFMFPLIWMVFSSFKTDPQIFSDITSLKAFLPPAFHGDAFFNYKEVLTKLPIIRAMLNSFFYIFIIIACSLVVNSMAGYAFARLNFPKRDVIFAVLLSLMIIPAQTVMLPQFSIIYKLGWVNSYLGLIMPAIASPLYIFLFRQNFLGIPKELEEAATIDGAGHLKTFFSMIVPLAKPVYGTVAILAFIAYWNDFVWPVMVISDTGKQTIQMALSTLFSIKPVNYGNVMAGLTFVTIPVLIIFLSMQKYYVQGIASTGSKN